MAQRYTSVYTIMTCMHAGGRHFESQLVTFMRSFNCLLLTLLNLLQSW